mmetsp:Transcript_45290/g.135392  ORF Transcript_45290/g.135392 Transcript_45290/m.135392 type:complete len:140 (+) Transcript_45290:74-493(+)
MGGKCCAGEEASGQPEAAPLAPSQSPVTEESIKAPSATEPKEEKRALETASAVEFTIRLKKTADETHLGIDVDLTDNVVLLIDKVNPGLVMEWNRTHPGEAVKNGDKVVAVNGSRGDAHQMAEVCKDNSDLEMVIQRSR